MDTLEAGGSWPPFLVQDRLLYTQSERNGENFDRLCAPMFVRSRISPFFHNEAHAANFGIYRTMEKLEKKITYYLLYGKRKRGLPCKKKSLEPVLFPVVLSDVDVNSPEVKKKGVWLFGPNIWAKMRFG